MTRPELIAACWTTAGDAAPLRGDEVSPLPISDRISAAARAGWQGFGINHADLAVARTNPGLAALRRMFGDHGVQHIELEFLTDWWTDGERRAASDAIRFELLSAAEILGARHIKVGAEFTDAPVDADRFAEELESLCRDADDSGTRIALEPMPWTNVPTVPAGADLVRRVGHPSGGLCVDIWHVFRAGTSLADLVSELTADIVVTVELDDADREVVGTLFEDTINNRRLCGHGVWDVPGFIRAMRRVGYDGPWGVEIISEEHRMRSLDEAVESTLETTLEVFAAADDRSE